MSTYSDKLKKYIGSNAAKISLAAAIAFPVYYAKLTGTNGQPEIKEEKQVSPKRKTCKKCRRYSDYYDAYYDWMPQATESRIMDAYNEYKESGLL